MNFADGRRREWERLLKNTFLDSIFGENCGRIRAAVVAVDLVQLSEAIA
jgi:hypothetical protein